jgi:hypothetical protein
MTPRTPLRSTAKPKLRPGPRNNQLQQSLVASADRYTLEAKRGRTVEFKVDVLSWAHHTEVDNGNGEPESLRLRRSGIDSVSRMGIRYQTGGVYSVKLLLRNSVPDLQLIFTLIQKASLLQAHEKTRQIRAKHSVYNAVPVGQCGALGGKLRTTTYRQTRKINPHIQGQVLLQGKVIYGLGGRGKGAVEKYSLQVVLSFRYLQVNKTDWVLALRKGNRKKPEHNYVVSFPAITDAEDDGDDGIEYGFRWEQDGC